MANPKLPFEAYRGEGPYVFVSYPHEDADRVYSVLVRLNDLGFDIWYDEGLEPGHSWPQELADRISECALFLIFISDDTLQSSFCMRETNFAVNRSRKVLAVHLDEVNLTNEFEFAIGDRQAIIAPRFDADTFETKLLEAISAHVEPARRATAKTEAVLETTAAPQTGVIDELPMRGRGWVATALAALIVIAAVVTLETSGLLAAVSIWTLAVALAAAAVWVQRSAHGARRIRWAHEVLVPEIRRRIETQDFGGGYLIVQQAERVLGEDPTLADLRDEVSLEAKVESDPAGAQVHIKPYAADEPWTFFGTTPVASRLALGTYQLKVEKAGFEPLLVATTHPSLFLQSLLLARERVVAFDPMIQLDRIGIVPEGMVRVPAIPVSHTFGGMTVGQVLDVPAFFADRYAVSNRDYKAFVDAPYRLWT